jgi:hypothetical protein
MWFFRRFSAAVIVAIACIASGEAAEKLRYEEIPNRLAPFGTVLAYRGFRVTTLDGKPHAGRRLRLESDHVRIFHLNNSYEDLASEQIARIEIRQGGRFFHHLDETAALALLLPFCVAAIRSHDASPLCLIPTIVTFPPVLAFAAATTPFYLAADGVAFLIPPKVYEITH